MCVKRLLVFSRIILGVFLSLQVGAAEARLVSAKNFTFEIVGEDSRSVQYVVDLSQHVIETASRNLDPKNMNFPQQVLVNLRPGESVAFDGDYFINIAARGFVTLDFNWSEDLSLEACIRGISEAFLVRYAIFNYGPSGALQIPDWPVCAISTTTYLRLRPALMGEFARAIGSTPAARMDDLLNAPRGARSDSKDGYWFFESLSESVDADARALLLNRAIAGFDLRDELSRLLGDETDTRHVGLLQSWWESTRERMQDRGEQIYERMEASRLWIEAFSKFQAEEGLIGLRELWDLREQPDIRATIKARYDLLRIRLPRVNPAYFNAARSLGAMFETLLEDGPIFEFVGNLTEFLGDFEDTKRLERIVKERL